MALTTAGVAGLLAERAMSDPKEAAFDTVNVQRLNVLEPDGKPRVIIANKTHFPGAYMNGKEYRHFTRKTGGFLFFNDEGDEVGGLIFDNNQGRGGHMSSLTFDQYKQDETVGLAYHEHGGHRGAGLTIGDRPDWDITPLLELSDKASRAPTPEARKAVEAEMAAYIRSKPGPTSADRVYVGKEDGDALVVLSDKQGRKRLQMKVGADGAPSIEMLDEAGKVTRRITGR
jgi:hypothetical protein